MASHPTSRPVVLVVEDEPSIRMGFMEVIEEAGFEPVAAKHADEAIEILKLRSDVRVMISDIRMPGPIDGITLVRTVRQRWPQVGLILTSGLIGGLPLQEMPERTKFFPKPIDQSSLLSAIEFFCAQATPAMGESQLP